MVAKQLFGSLFSIFFALLAIIIQPGPAEARCDSYIKSEGEQFSSLEVCASSLQRPFYRIVRHYYTNGEALIFSFAPRSRKLLCYRYEVGDSTDQHCENYGVSFFPRVFKSDSFQTFMHDLSRMSAQQVEELYTVNHIFVSPSFDDDVWIERCFVIVREGIKRIDIGYDKNNIIDLSSCLVSLEKFLGSTDLTYKKIE